MNKRETWLSQHPDQTPIFLNQALDNGFDLIDLNGKLILIYEGDFETVESIEPIIITQAPKTLGEQAYEARLKGEKWKDINESLGAHALLGAKYWARKKNLQWPIRHNDL